MDIAIIGAGGIGGFVGGMLSRAGHEVTLVDQWYEHICEIQKNGLKIKTGMTEKSINLSGTLIVIRTGIIKIRSS